MLINMIPLLCASEFDDEITDYCLNQGISTHYQSDVAWIENDNNPIAKFLNSNNIELDKNGKGWWVGILAT